MQDSLRAGDARAGSVLVTGASGNVGRAVVERLAAHGTPVRRLDRRQLAPPAGVDSAVGDLTEAASVRQALRGVDTVFLIWPLLDAAAAEPLIAELATASPRVVYLSSTAIDDDADRQSDPIVQVHANLEVMLRGAGLRLTVLRSDTLAANTRGWAAQLASGDVVKGLDIPRTAVVDERDVAAAAVAVMLGTATEPDTYLLTGPELLSRAEQVAVLGAVLGRELEFDAVPPELARGRLLADGRSEQLVEALIAASRRRPESHLVTDHVERLTGRPPGTFAQWVHDHRHEFVRRRV